MKKDLPFDELYQDIETAVKQLEQGDQSINDSIKLYQQAVQKIQQAMKILEQAENEIKEISSGAHESQPKQIK